MREKKKKCWECVEIDGLGWGNNFKAYLKQKGVKNWLREQGEGRLTPCFSPSIRKLEQQVFESQEN